MGRSLEGIDDVTLCYAGQIIVVKERALETCCVDLCQYYLEEQRIKNTKSLN